MTPMDPKAHEINSAIVANVRKHRVLYDPSVPEYAIKKFSKIAWAAVAKATNLAEEDCKFRWRNLRISFLRYNRTKRNSDTKIKPYYLEQEMAFMLPFIRSRPNTLGKPRKTNSLTKKSPTKRLFAKIKKDEIEELVEQEDEQIEEDDTQDIEFEYVDEDNEKHQMILESAYKRDTPVSLIAEEHDGMQMQDDFQDTTPKGDYYEIVSSRQEQDDNPDWNFLRSFLPDLQKMSPGQKIKFKLTLCTAISELLYTSDV